MPHHGRRSTLPTGKRTILPHTKNRAVGEQANTTLKSRRLPQKLRWPTTRITNTAQATPTLHLNTQN
ncbi:transposase [Streptomyces sp. NBRC 110611]|nr:transposase [Streptomyces sp. NBRC 110611]